MPASPCSPGCSPRQPTAGCTTRCSPPAPGGGELRQDPPLRRVQLHRVRHRRAGREPVVVTVDGVGVGITLCYDIRFPTSTASFGRPGRLGDHRERASWCRVPASSSSGQALAGALWTLGVSSSPPGRPIPVRSWRGLRPAWRQPGLLPTRRGANAQPAPTRNSWRAIWTSRACRRSRDTRRCAAESLWTSHRFVRHNRAGGDDAATGPAAVRPRIPGAPTQRIPQPSPAGAGLRSRGDESADRHLPQPAQPPLPPTPPAVVTEPEPEEPRRRGPFGDPLSVALAVVIVVALALAAGVIGAGVITRATRPTPSSPESRQLRGWDSAKVSFGLRPFLLQHFPPLPHMEGRPPPQPDPRRQGA